MRVTILSWLGHDKDNDKYFLGARFFRGHTFQREDLQAPCFFRVQVCPDVGFKVGQFQYFERSGFFRGHIFQGSYFSKVTFFRGHNFHGSNFSGLQRLSVSFYFYLS